MAGPEVALVARAHGVLTHLLTRRALEPLSDATDLPSFARGLARLGSVIDPMGETPGLGDIELAIRRTSSRHVRTLGRWQERGPGVIDIVRADFDRRSLRALIRGAAEAAPAAARLAGLIPTPRLPERVLGELARQASPRAVAGLLTVLGDPDAAMLSPLVASTQPELFAVDAALHAAWARRALAIARRQDAAVLAFVRERIDLSNVQLALLVAGRERADSSRVFVEGGEALSRLDFSAATAAPSPREALDLMRNACRNFLIGHTLAAATPDVGAIERMGLGRLLSRLAYRSRREPLGSSYLLRTLLHIDSQAHDLRVLAWGAAFGVPPGLRAALLVTP